MVVEPRQPCVVLTGENGAGKTNLLEAVSLLAPGRGLRGAPFAEISRQGADGGWAVAARIAGPTGDTEIGTGLAGMDTDGQATRQVKIDGTMRGSGGLGDHVRVVWLTPAMDRLFTGPAGDRRRFFDRLVAAFDPAHGTRVNSFEKAMRERNRLLDRGNADPAWLDGVETQMAENGVAIAAARRDAVASLAAILEERRTRAPDSPFPWMTLALDGLLEDLLDGAPAVEAEDRYRRILREARGRDAAAGRTLDGPHRADIVVEHGPKAAPARQCSTGEQKALLVGMVLAHARVIQGTFDGYPPILLLDEIAAHLDPGRRQALFAELAELGAQVWMTGTDTTLFAELGDRACFNIVADGRVTSS
jgi:DNA replication and repair protein RecF